MAGTCLIIDDDEMFVEIFTRVVRPYGLTATAVNTVPAAVSALMQRDYDVVFLDLRLGNVDGTNVIDAIRKIKPHILHRILAVTSYPGGAKNLPPEVVVIDKANLAGVGARVAAVLGLES
ncbi:MAG TPA: response regulator [Thermoanaerobaculia bacterium]